MAILAYQYPTYQPAMRIISSITNANPVTITTSFNHQYLTGTIVRLDIPSGFGMTQLNQQYAPITVTSTTTFTMPIDTTLFSPFLYQINVGTTDGSGDASGTCYVPANAIPYGQTFLIGSQLFTVVLQSGALQTTGSGSGTFNLSTGAFTFTGAAINSNIYWTPIVFPQNSQYAQVVPIGENNDMLTAAVQNVLPYSAS